MVGNREIDLEQLNNRTHQPFGLAPRQPEQGAQGQHRGDRQIRVLALSTRGRPGLGLPSRDGLRAEPHCEAAALTQGGVVFSPVADPVPLLRNMVAAIGVGPCTA